MSGKLNILCVEDDPAEREALRAYGEILEWNITLCATCTDAYNIAREQTFDVIATDQNLPDCTGVNMIRLLRKANGPNRETPVLLVSWNLSDSVRMIARKVAIEAALAKPVLLSTFKIEVQRLAAGRPCTQ